MPNKTAIKLTNLWRDFGPNTYPIKMDDLVGGVINQMDSQDKLILKYDTFDSFDGLMMPGTRANQWFAIINCSITNEGRRNFTAAHEIYHYLGHRKLQKNFKCTKGDIRDFREKNLEKEANEFASQLILPPDKIRPCTKNEFNYESVQSVAKTLGASVSAVAYKWLKLSSTDIAFVVSRDGFIVHGYPSTSAKKKGVFIKRDTELHRHSITHGCLKTGISSSGVVEENIWHSQMGAEEHVYVGNDGFTYTFLEFLS